MQYKIELRPLAAMEAIEAYDWYESQREGLGLEFLEALETFYNTLLGTLLHTLIMINPYDKEN